MKTLTEFSGFTLKEAQAKKAALSAEGKTEEEIQAVLQEQLKLDEAKVGFYKNVVDMTSSRMDRVKRVVVALRSNEQEKVPENYTEREGHFYLIEYFAEAGARPSSRSFQDRDDRRGGRGERGRGDRSRGEAGRGDRGRGDRPRGDRPMTADRQDRAPRGPKPEGMFRTDGKPSESKPARKPRTPRPERAPGAARAPKGPRGAGELRLVLKGESQTTLRGSGTESAQAAPPASETTAGQPQA